MLTTADAKALGGIARQIRGLLHGIDQLPEAFEQVEGFEVRLSEAKKAKLAIDADVAALRASFTKLDEDYTNLRQQYARLDTDHASRKRELEASLSTLLADVAAAQQLKQEAEDHLNSLRAKIA
jgi:chromosome segregation ATPase